MPNAALEAIAAEAERGNAVGIGLTAGAITVNGVPVSTQEYFDQIAHSTASAAFAAKKAKKADRDRVWAETHELYRAYFASIRAAVRTEPETLYFISPAVVHATGAAGSPPGVCVPFENIDAWWYGDPNWRKQSGSGGGLFVGGAIPIDT